MNRLSKEKRTQSLRLLVEGNSLRSCSRIADVSINTVTSILVEAGEVCMKFHNETMLGISCKKLQLDEIVTFVYAKEYGVNARNRKNEKSRDAWLWIAMDPDTKLVVSWYVGEREIVDAMDFIRDLKSRLKLDGKILITTDGLKLYWGVIRDVFGRKNADLGQLMKFYGKNKKPGDGETYAKGRFRKIEKFQRIGTPDPKEISTSYIERQNLTIRMCNRRYTRRTNAFSKKWENHIYSVALHFVYYNFIRPHKTLRVTPAMEAKVTRRFMKLEDIVALMDLHRDALEKNDAS